MVGAMGERHDFLAVDIGAASGRVILGRWDGARFDLEGLHRFPNEPVRVAGALHWDVLRLWHEVKAGLARYRAQAGATLSGIGIDTWAIDFGLLDRQGRLLGNPYHYRDGRTAGIAERIDAVVGPGALYAQTGIQRLPFNTLYQLASLGADDPQLAAAESLLLIPDLLGYWLTGRRVAEYTNATTTQFLDARTGDWATDLLATLGLPTAPLPLIVAPGTLLGELLPEVRAEVGLPEGTPFIATATHDTASAVAAIPDLDARSAYISSGTWSLVGVELPAPILTEAARARDFTNEGGVAGTIRFLKNVGGLWLLQECQRSWERDGQGHSWPEIVALAEAAPPLRSLVDPDAPAFLSPADMPTAMREHCRQTGQPIPDSVGTLARCCLESLALKYRWTIEAIEELTGRTIETIRVVGGGSQNALLCQLTADACGRRVVAGPTEATALGNCLVQALAIGVLPDLAAGRRAIAASTEQRTYMPGVRAAWDAAYEGFVARLR
jgi:rhamnulokinase